MRKAGAKDYSSYSKDILRITKKPVSCEVFADDTTNMILQGNEISKWGKNVYVKVPVTNSEGKFMGKVIKTLNEKKYVPNFLIERDIEVNDLGTLLNGLKLVGDYLDKTILTIFSSAL